MWFINQKIKGKYIKKENIILYYCDGIESLQIDENVWCSVVILDLFVFFGLVFHMLWFGFGLVNLSSHPGALCAN